MVAASWDSVIFDVGRESLVRVPMMEPERGTKAHVGALLRPFAQREGPAGGRSPAGESRRRGCLTARTSVGKPQAIARRHRWLPVTPAVSRSRATRRDDEVDEVAAESETEVAERHEKLTEDVDDLLDEIDSVLEENAEEFVRGYVQKGGQ